MKTNYKSSLLLVGSLAVAGTAYGQSNTAYGEDALYHNDSGIFNTAFGFSSLFYNFDGNYNTATGTYSLFENVSGVDNTATGYQALYGDFTNGPGSYNTAMGFNALYSNYGNSNIAMGYQAGFNVTTGSNNIEIGHMGLAADNGAIRIGTKGSQKEVFIAGIENSKITGSAVYVTAGGRLGVLASSERYKAGIAPMGTNTDKLGQLRPVTFKLKTDAAGTVQYGLIAEEVAKVYPELVIRDEHGRIDGVRYDELAPMLLNEVQKEQAEIRNLKQQVTRINDLERALAEMHAVLAKLQSKDQLVAQR
jgi:hypothetical protein